MDAYKLSREDPNALEQFVAEPYFVVGGTPGGLYSLMKYRPLGGTKVDWSTKTFDLLVVDEASQASVPEGILAAAFLKDAGNIIVVGDHRQMPPIVAHEWKREPKRTVSQERPYLSLFEFLRDRGFPVVGLDESFRLHAAIADFLEENVYRQDGIRFFSRKTELLPPPPHVSAYVDAVLDPRYPIVVIEHDERQSQQINLVEQALAEPLIRICAGSLQLKGTLGLGIFVSDRAQKALLRTLCSDLADAGAIDTVECFQGSERDVIIVSATASDPDYVLVEASFLLNLNRLNVALSRPKKKLIVIASRSIVDLLTSDLDVFNNAVIWKRLYLQYANTSLF